ncbi:low-affinity phosphate transporter [Dissophora globulifera]|uniref:Low-affinity phosphate transporter n=1 Tax=Dissophora globulifera TaxID=979702 RepID=A0A9P6RMV8_9FUNG|nr:low-affinity phosphate transporter [Dissophora globulifera]
MKFSHQLQFNVVPEWADYYLAYSNLKKIIYQVEKDLVTAGGPSNNDLESGPIEPNERSGLLATSKVALAKAKANALFLPALDKELEKIVTFYFKKERELYAEVEALSSDVEFVEYLDPTLSRQASSVSHATGKALLNGGSVRKTRTRQNSRASRGSISLGRSGTWRYDEALENATAATLANAEEVAQQPDHPPKAILEGHDTGHEAGSSSATIAAESGAQDIPQQARNDDEENENEEDDDDDGRSLWFDPDMEEERMRYRHNCIEMFVNLSELQAYVKLNSTGFSKILKKYDKISENNTKKGYINQVVLKAYPFKSETTAKLQGQIDRTIGIYARIFTGGDLDVAKRSLRMHLKEHMVWERNTIWRDMIGMERKSQAVAVRPSSAMKQNPITIKTLCGSFDLPEFRARDVFVIVFCCVVFVCLLNIQLFEGPEQQNCFAILIFASLLWATEAMPLFVTSLLVPLLVVMLRVMRSDDEDHTRLDSHAAAKKIFSLMFSPVIMLLLGGFAVAAAMSKFHIAKAMATVVLSKAGTRPSAVLLANMLVATVASMWISNVAAPVLCFSLIQPILRTLPPGSSFSKCLILGIALASNVGGMASPISSPQNIIAIEYMNPAPSWLEWFLVALPVCLICDLAIWVLLLWVYQPSSNTPTISTIRSTKDPITRTQVFVCAVTVLTIILWCFEHRLEWLFGDMGLIAIIPLLAFFGTGILTKEDFNNFLWTVIILAMGGIALGKAVESSGLLHMIAVEVQGYVKDMSAFAVCCVFASMVLVIATFISHTVGALIILPIVAQVGATLPDPHPRLLVMSAALMCSGAMGLPVSGFPNMNAIMMEDEMGQQYLSTSDFLKVGVPSSAVACLVIVTMGYGLMTLLGW